MGLSKTNIQDRLRPFLIVNVDESILTMLTDTFFLNLYNDTANDFNDMGLLNIERYNKETGSVAAESTDTTYRNYLLQGKISKILYFKYESDAWASQQYVYTEDRVALKTAPGDGVEMDIIYLRKCEDIEDATDEIDLPENVLPEYVELLKARILADYGKSSNSDYESSLRFWSEKANQKTKKHAVNNLGTFRHWFYQNDDAKYDITDFWIQEDSFVASDDGDLIYTET